MNVGSSLITHTQSSELVQPRDGALDHPAQHAQSSILISAACRQQRLDAANPQRDDVAGPGIGLVGHRGVGTKQRRADLAADRWDGIDQFDQEPAIGFIRARDRARQRHALGVGDHVMLGARPRAIRGIAACFFPGSAPAPTARTLLESIATTERSRAPRRRSSSSRRAWSSSQIPNACQSRRRRQHDTPEPQPISLGSISQGMPDCRTKRMPVSAWRGVIGLRPGCRKRRGLSGGKSGSMNAHRSSSRSGLAIGVCLHAQGVRASMPEIIIGLIDLSSVHSERRS